MEVLSTTQTAALCSICCGLVADAGKQRAVQAGDGTRLEMHLVLSKERVNPPDDIRVGSKVADCVVW